MKIAAGMHKYAFRSPGKVPDQRRHATITRGNNPRSMPVSVMNIRIMRVRVHQRLMPVRIRMRLAPGAGWFE